MGPRLSDVGATLLNPEPNLRTVFAIFFDPAAGELSTFLPKRNLSNPTLDEHTFPSVTIFRDGFPDLRPFFPNDIPEDLVLTKSIGSNKNVRFPLHLWFSPRALSAHTPTNRAIAALTQGYEQRRWCGPVLVFKFAGPRTREFRDVSDVDFVTLTQYFIDFSWAHCK